MFTILPILLAAGLAILTFLVLYLWFFAFIYLASTKSKSMGCYEAESRFVFVVPAHNEEAGIQTTVQSLLNVRYPRALFDVVVIADNCTDLTAEQARAGGAECLIRHNKSLRGKGYALQYAFTELMQRGYDAFIVIDADSIVSDNYLSVLNCRLQRGEKVIQSYNGISNPDVSVLTYLFQVGNLIENKLFWLPKEKLNFPIMLRGNGMCFSDEVLEKYPWNAFSIVEDSEYTLRLIGQRVKIHFAAEIGVYACQPENMKQAFAQRVRWASGNASLTKGRAIKLIISGFTGHHMSLADLGISLIAGSRPLLLVMNIILLILALLAKINLVVYWAGLLFFGQLLYIAIGVFINGLSFKKGKHLIFSPFYLVWLCTVSLLGLAGFRENQWIRTSR